MLNDYPRQQLHLLVRQFGKTICHDPRRCEAILRDLCPEHRREVNVLVCALKEQVVTDLLNLSKQLPPEVYFENYTKRLHDNLGIAQPFAFWAVESWALALEIIQQPQRKPPLFLNIPEKTVSLALPQKWWQPFSASVAKLLTFLPKKTHPAIQLTPPVAPLPIFFHDTFKNGKPAIRLVRIQGGKFLMGSPATEIGRYSIERLHEVIINDFILGQYAVTFAEYDLFVKATGWRKPLDNQWGRGQRPVINVSWEDALSYAAWLSSETGHHYRLPTEAEWEYACRAGTITAFSSGDAIRTDQANFNGTLDYDEVLPGDNRKQTLEVGSFAANPYGLYDMHGNVWEWTGSSYSEDYQGEELCSGGESSISHKVLRGGSWANTKRSLRSASRIRRDLHDKADFIGFRLARVH